MEAILGETQIMKRLTGLFSTLSVLVLVAAAGFVLYALPQYSAPYERFMERAEAPIQPVHVGPRPKPVLVKLSDVIESEEDRSLTERLAELQSSCVVSQPAADD